MPDLYQPQHDPLRAAILAGQQYGPQSTFMTPQGQPPAPPPAQWQNAYAGQTLADTGGPSWQPAPEQGSSPTAGLIEWLTSLGSQGGGGIIDDPRLEGLIQAILGGAAPVTDALASEAGAMLPGGDPSGVGPLLAAVPGFRTFGKQVDHLGDVAKQVDRSPRIPLSEGEGFWALNRGIHSDVGRALLRQNTRHGAPAPGARGRLPASETARISEASQEVRKFPAEGTVHNRYWRGEANYPDARSVMQRNRPSEFDYDAGTTRLTGKLKDHQINVAPGHRALDRATVTEDLPDLEEIRNLGAAARGRRKQSRDPSDPMGAAQAQNELFSRQDDVLGYAGDVLDDYLDGEGFDLRSDNWREILEEIRDGGMSTPREGPIWKSRNLDLFYDHLVEIEKGLPQSRSNTAGR